jgi:hypothetical protein
MTYSLATGFGQLGAAAAYLLVQRTASESSFIPMPANDLAVSLMPHSSSVQDEPTEKPKPTPAPPTVEDPIQGDVGYTLPEKTDGVFLGEVMANETLLVDAPD